MKYVYSFVVCPEARCDFGRAICNYFRVFRRRTEMHFTEEEFSLFIWEMEGDGFTLKEVIRRPYVEPEQVIV